MTEIYFTPEADEQVERIDLEWREHARTNPDLFADELDVAQRKAMKMKDVYEVYRRVHGEAIRRVLMRRAKHHLYYFYEADADLVVVVAVWGARRKAGPPLETYSF